MALSTFYPNPIYPDRGGFVARSLESLARRSEAGWRVSVVNPIGIPPIALGKTRELAHLDPVDDSGSITVHRPHYTLVPKLGGRRDTAAIARATLAVIRKLHAEAPVSLIAAQSFYPDGPAAAGIARQIGVPLSIKARGNDIDDWGKVDFARDQMVEAARRASGMLAVSEALKRRMVALGMDRSRIAVHLTGLDRDRFRPLDHDRLRAQLAKALGFTIPDNTPLLACVGELAERKGQDIAIAALAGIEGAQLIVSGEGEDEAHLRSLAADLDLASRVHFVGALDHDMLPLVLSASDAMVLPTANEGLANPWVEALACGTPVITSDTGGAREVIVDDIAGRLVSRDPESVAAGVNSVLNDPPLRRHVAARAARFSWDRHAAELAAHYDRLTARAGRVS
ncbi:MAG: glycosyltransferase [Erythrobacter sp.]